MALSIGPSHSNSSAKNETPVIIITAISMTLVGSGVVSEHCGNALNLSGIEYHAAVVAIPVALKQFVRVVFLLKLKEAA